MLKKEFRKKDVNRARNLIMGKTGASTGTQIGYSKKTIDYKDHFSEIYDSFLTEHDIWITPVCSFEAYKHQRAGKPFTVNGKKVGYTEAMASFTFTTAFSGHPIVVIPIGKKKNGMQTLP